jgi:heme A synthase
LILACAAAGWIKARPIRWIAWPPFISLPFLIAVVIFGALAVLTGLPPWLAAIDLGSALLIQALLTAAAAAAVGMRVAGVVPTKLAYRTAFSRLAALALAAVYLTLVSAPLAAGSGSPTRCLSFPLWAPNPADPAGFPLVARWLLSLLAGGLILASLALRRSAPFLHPAVRKLSTLTAILFFAQAALGILISVTGFSVGLMIPYIAIAAALWGGMVALAVMAGFLTA